MKTKFIIIGSLIVIGGITGSLFIEPVEAQSLWYPSNNYLRPVTGWGVYLPSTTYGLRMEGGLIVNASSTFLGDLSVGYGIVP